MRQCIRSILIGVIFLAAACGTRPVDSTEPTPSGATAEAPPPEKPLSRSGDIADELPGDTSFLLAFENPKAFLDALELSRILSSVAPVPISAQAQMVLGADPFTAAGLEQLGFDPEGIAGFAYVHGKERAFYGFAVVSDRDRVVAMLRKLGKTSREQVTGPFNVGDAQVYRLSGNPLTEAGTAFIFRGKRLFVTVSDKASTIIDLPVRNSLGHNKGYKSVAWDNPDRHIRSYTNSAEVMLEAMGGSHGGNSTDPTADFAKAMPHGFAELTFAGQTIELRAATVVTADSIVDRLFREPDTGMEAMQRFGGEADLTLTGRFNPKPALELLKVLESERLNKLLSAAGVSSSELSAKLSGEIGLGLFKQSGEAKMVVMLGLSEETGIDSLVAKLPPELKKKVKRSGEQTSLPLGDVTLSHRGRWLAISDVAELTTRALSGEKSPPETKEVKRLFADKPVLGALLVRYGNLSSPSLWDPTNEFFGSYEGCKDSEFKQAKQKFEKLVARAQKLRGPLLKEMQKIHRDWERGFGELAVIATREDNKLRLRSVAYLQKPFPELIIGASKMPDPKEMATYEQLEQEYWKQYSEVYRLGEERCQQSTR